MGKRLLLFALFIFILIDVGLFISYISKNKPALLGQKKQFSLAKKTFPETVQTRILKADYSHGALEQIELAGRIVEAPYLQNEKFKTTISFDTRDGKTITANLILGKPEEELNSFLSKKGVLDGEQFWTDRPVSEIISLLQIDSPLIFRIYFQEVPERLYQQPVCAASCRQLYDEINRLYKNNKKVVDAIRGWSTLDEPVDFGPPSALTIYTSENE